MCMILARLDPLGDLDAFRFFVEPIGARGLELEQEQRGTGSDRHGDNIAMFVF